MDVAAAVFRKVRAPLTIEHGRRRQALGARGSGAHGRDRGVPQRSARRRRGRAVSARPADRARPRGRRRRRGGRRRGDDGQARRPCRRLPLGVLRQLPAMPFRPSESVHRRHRHPRPTSAAPRLSQNGEPMRQFIGISSYAEKMLLHENSIVRIDPELPLDKAALVGCGVLTGVGAALRSSGLEAGQTVAVFGCGGVGLSIVQGARIGGARQIIAVDQFEAKREMAIRAGATHFVNSAEDDPVEGGAGADRRRWGRSRLRGGRASPSWCGQAIESLAIRGTATIVGVLPPDAMIEFPWMAIRPECRVQTSRMGSNRFRYRHPALSRFLPPGPARPRRDGHHGAAGSATSTKPSAR